MNEISLAEYRQQIESAIEHGRHEEALAHGRRILEAYPKHIGAYWLLGKAMLEAGHNEHAADMFRRVLSADPEHARAWVGISQVAQRSGELEAAVWYLERAFELATEDETVAAELRHLLGELKGTQPERLQLTQGALARLYLRGDLLGRAVSELRRMLEEHPDRLDLKVALAEALWRDGERLQATEVCQEILDGQPYALKANLILGEIWTSSGRAEGGLYLERAQAVDPENQMAQELFGVISPLPPASPRITPLDDATVAEAEPPAWVAELEGLPAAEEITPAETDKAMEAQIEPPAWLWEVPGQPAPAAPPAVEPPEPEDQAAAPDGEGLEAMDELATAELPMADEMPDEEVLEWLSGLEGEEMPSEALEGEAEMPAWLAEVDLEPAPGEVVRDAEGTLVGEEPELQDIPDWLRGLAPPEPEPHEAAPLEATTDLWEEEIPVPESPPAFDRDEEVTERLPWLEREEVPPKDEDLAWLEQWAEGEVEEVPAEEAEVEAEAPIEEEALERAALAEPPIAMDEAEEPVAEPEPAREALEEGPPEAPEEAPPVEVIEEAPLEDLTAFVTERQAYAEAHPEDHEAWLDLGRALWQADNRHEAIETYNHLIGRGELLDEIIPDLEDYAEKWPETGVRQALGDAYMRADRLSDALDIYRQALAGL